MLVVSRHAAARARERLGAASDAEAEQVIRRAVEAPAAIKIQDDGAVRYGALVAGVALVVTVVPSGERRVVVSVRPGTCGSSGAARGRLSRAGRYVWERSTWTPA